MFLVARTTPMVVNKGFEFLMLFLGKYNEVFFLSC